MIALPFLGKKPSVPPAPVAMTITPCPKCGTKLRHKAVKGEVTCPCGREFSWSPPKAEMREVRFRCTKTNGAFTVVFARESEREKFRVKKIATQEGGVLRGSLAALPGTGTDSRFKVGDPREGRFDVDAFDFAGWRCACCGHDGSRIYSYVSCQDCNELVCGWSIVQLSHGVSTFRCTADCGGSGELIDGDDFLVATHVEVERRMGSGKAGPKTSGGGAPTRKPGTDIAVPGTHPPTSINGRQDGRK